VDPKSAATKEFRIMSWQNARVKLSEHWQDKRFKCFKKSIGGRRFYLTADRTQSERAAMALMAAWSQNKSSGGSGWSHQTIADCLRLAGIKEGIASWLKFVRA
jgi:hypothetical protein